MHENSTALSPAKKAMPWRRVLLDFGPRNELIIALLTFTIVGTLTVVPRPTYPQVLPLPVVDRASLTSRESEELTRAHLAKDGSLDKEVRAVGEQVRRMGMVLSLEKPVASEPLAQIQKDVARLLNRPEEKYLVSGTEGLLRLRALQAQMFLVAAHKWARSGELSTELRELGGPFHHIAALGWVTKSGQFKLTDDELRLFFRVHFGKLTGLHNKHPFGPSLEELRSYYSANLRHPAAPEGDKMTKTISQIGFVRALGKVDSSYPASLAEGMLRLRLGQPHLAMQGFANHLDGHPDGPWTHLARNHLILASQLSSALDQVGH